MSTPRALWGPSLTVLLVVAGVVPGSAQQNPFPIEGLIVTASPNPRPAEAVAAHVTVLEGDDLRAQGLLDLSDALRRVAGISVVRGGSYGAATSVFLRGGESDYVQVLVDGVAVNQPGGAFDFAQLTLENVERIEVVRGPMSALYGSDAVAGVVHVVTRTGEGRPTLGASLRAGTYGRLDGTASLTGGGERARYGVSLGRYRTDGVLPLNNRHAHTVLTGTARLAPDDRTRVDLSVRVAERAYHFPTDGSGAGLDQNAFTYGDETTVGVVTRRQLSSTWSVGASLRAHQTDGGLDDQPDSPADTLGFYGFTSLDHVRRVAADLTTTARVGRLAATGGVAFEDQRQRSFTESLSEYGPSSDRSEYERWNRAGYTHLTWDGRAVSLNAGSRLEDNERYGTFLTWQAGAAWRVLPAARLRASAGRGIKEPGFFETFATGFARGNPDLEPERSLSFEGGLDLSLPGGFTARATAFGQRFTDLIQYTPTAPEPGGANYFNVAEARASGLELGMTGRPLPSLTADLGWTWLTTEVLDGGFDDDADATFAPGERLLRRPAHTLDARLAWDRGGRLTLGADVHVVGARIDRDFSVFPAVRTELPRYLTAGASAELRVAGGEGGLPATVLTFRGENLFDERYQEALGFAAPGRALVVGARVSLGGG
jgi:vitamin B12 transporter